MDAVLETWRWPYFGVVVVVVVVRQQVPAIKMDTPYSPELSSLTAEPGEI